jgi:glycosyltransferase involved in cell wall biosynthesis
MVRGGIETWLMHVLRSIDRERFRMDFVVEQKGCAYDEEVQALGSRIIHCPHRRQPLAYARRFMQILRNQGPYDVVHSHYHYYSGYVCRLARHAKVPIRIAHSHNDYSQDPRERVALWHIYVYLMRRWLVHNATIGLAASREAAASLYGTGWEADPHWRLLYYGVDLNPFRINIDSYATRAELGIPADAFVVGHVGRFDEQKNHSFLVDIAAELAQREPKVRVLLVGDGPLRPAIKERVVQAGILDKFIFTGERSDIARLMLGAMDVFVLPSHHEGLPLVGIEAQAAGLPFVMSDAITKEVCVVSPLIQQLSLSQSASAWAEAILAKRNAPPSIDRRDALNLIEKTGFDVSFSVGELEGVYEG